MLIAVPAETEADEGRVAATPETVKKFVGLGADVVVEAGAGQKSGVTDADYEAAGAKVVPGRRSGAQGRRSGAEGPPPR